MAHHQAVISVVADQKLVLSAWRRADGRKAEEISLPGEAAGTFGSLGAVTARLSVAAHDASGVTS